MSTKFSNDKMNKQRNLPGETYDTHNIAQRVELLRCTATMEAGQRMSLFVQMTI